MKGFFGRILTIDLDSRTSTVEAPEEASLARTLGGKGLATQLLLNKNPVGVDPFDPANRFIIAQKDRHKMIPGRRLGGHEGSVIVYRLSCLLSR